MTNHPDKITKVEKGVNRHTGHYIIATVQKSRLTPPQISRINPWNL
jgi:hypothetical protein